MTDAEINSFVRECCMGWLAQGATPGEIMAIGAGVLAFIGVLGEFPNEKCHEMLASILQQRDTYEIHEVELKGADNG